MRFWTGKTLLIAAFTLVFAGVTTYHQVRTGIVGRTHTGALVKAVPAHVPVVRSAAAPLAPAASVPAQAGGIAVMTDPVAAQRLVVRAIDAARVSVELAAERFASPTIAAALVRAKDRGVRVQVLSAGAPTGVRRAALELLAAHGVAVHTERQAPAHDAFMLIDGATVETGGFDYSGDAPPGVPAAAFLVSADTGVAGTYAEAWRRLWSSSSAL